MQQKYLKLKRLRDECQNKFRVWVSTRKRTRELLKKIVRGLSSPRKPWRGYVSRSVYVTATGGETIDEDKNACQELERSQNLLGDCVTDFAVFCRDHIDSVLSSELVGGEFRFLLYILRGTHSPGAAANARVPPRPLPIVLCEEVKIHLEIVSFLIKKLWRSKANREESTITQEILDELQEGPNDEEMRTMILNFIEAKFVEACKSQL